MLVREKRLLRVGMGAANVALAAVGVEGKEFGSEGRRHIARTSSRGHRVLEMVVLSRQLPDSVGILAMTGEFDLSSVVSHVVAVTEDDLPRHAKVLVDQEDIFP